MNVLCGSGVLAVSNQAPFSFCCSEVVDSCVCATPLRCFVSLLRRVVKYRRRRRGTSQLRRLFEVSYFNISATTKGEQYRSKSLESFITERWKRRVWAPICTSRVGVGLWTIQLEMNRLPGQKIETANTVRSPMVG